MKYHEVSSEWLELKPGDSVEGLFLEQEEVTLQEGGDPVTRYHILDPSGSRFSFLGGAALDRTFRARSIEPGTYVKIELVGTRPLKGGRSLKIWRVWIAQPETDDELSLIEELRAIAFGNG